MTESTTPLGCGPEGAVSDHADLLNALEDMAGSYAYAVRKPVLREAGRTIMALERKCNELREEMERDGVAAEAENGALHDALTERDAARQSLSESVDARDAAQRATLDWIKQNAPGGWIDDLRKKADALTATFQLDKLYDESYRLIVTAPNGDCAELRPRGERAERVLREAHAALEMTK